MALPIGFSITWWPPVVPASDCATLTGGWLGPDTYEPLIYIGPNGAIDYSRSIASHIRVSNHDTVFTIPLKSSWQWSNGHPITAADVVYDAQLIMAASAPSSPMGYCFTGEGGMPTEWKAVTAVNAHTVQITTTQPVNPLWFELNGVAQLVPLPKASWDKYANLDQELSWIKSIANKPNNPVYQVIDGPYRLKKWVSDQYWEFAINPKYTGPYKPRIARILYDYEASDASTFVGLKKGTVEVAQVPLSYVTPVKALKSYHLSKEALFAFWFMKPNLRPGALNGEGALLAQLYIRQALEYGIDQPGIIKAVLHGYGYVDNGPVPSQPHNVYYDYHMPVYYPYDPARGATLLEAHGWHLVNGVMEKNGQTLSFQLLVPSGDTTTTDMMELVEADWAKEGIQATIKIESQSTIGSTEYSPQDVNKWAIVAGGGWIYAPDFYPSGDGIFNPGAGINSGGYSSAEMDRLITATTSGGTLKQVQERFDAYQRYAAQQLPFIWMPAQDFLYAIANNVHGYSRNYNPFFSYTSDNYLTLTP